MVLGFGVRIETVLLYIDSQTVKAGIIVMADYGRLWRIMADYDGLRCLYIHSQSLKALQTPKRVWNSSTQRVIVKNPANTMRGMVRCGCEMSTRS